MEHDQNHLAQKQADFATFFMLEHTVNINLAWLALDHAKPDMILLQQTMPDAFAIANEAADLKNSALRPIPSLGEQGEKLMTYLNLQSRKIDILFTTILQQQDDPTERHQTHKFGAAGCVVQLAQPIEVGRFARLKMFIPEEAAAVFCYAEVISCDLLPDLDVYEVSLLYTVIRELDQEVLVRCTMHLQTQQLKARQTGAS